SALNRMEEAGEDVSDDEDEDDDYSRKHRGKKNVNIVSLETIDPTSAFINPFTRADFPFGLMTPAPLPTVAPKKLDEEESISKKVEKKTIKKALPKPSTSASSSAQIRASMGSDGGITIINDGVMFTPSSSATTHGTTIIIPAASLQSSSSPSPTSSSASPTPSSSELPATSFSSSSSLIIHEEASSNEDIKANEVLRFANMHHSTSAPVKADLGGNTQAGSVRRDIFATSNDPLTIAEPTVEMYVASSLSSLAMSADSNEVASPAVTIGSSYASPETHADGITSADIGAHSLEVPKRRKMHIVHVYEVKKNKQSGSAESVTIATSTSAMLRKRDMMPIYDIVAPIVGAAQASSVQTSMVLNTPYVDIRVNSMQRLQVDEEDDDDYSDIEDDTGNMEEGESDVARDRLANSEFEKAASDVVAEQSSVESSAEPSIGSSVESASESASLLLNAAPAATTDVTLSDVALSSVLAESSSISVESSSDKAAVLSKSPRSITRKPRIVTVTETSATAVTTLSTAAVSSTSAVSTSATAVSTTAAISESTSVVADSTQAGKEGEDEDEDEDEVVDASEFNDPALATRNTSFKPLVIETISGDKIFTATTEASSPIGAVTSADNNSDDSADGSDISTEGDINTESDAESDSDSDNESDVKRNAGDDSGSESDSDSEEKSNNEADAEAAQPKRHLANNPLTVEEGEEGDFNPFHAIQRIAAIGLREAQQALKDYEMNSDVSDIEMLTTKDAKPAATVASITEAVISPVSEASTATEVNSVFDINAAPSSTVSNDSVAASSSSPLAETIVVSSVVANSTPASEPSPKAVRAAADKDSGSDKDSDKDSEKDSDNSDSDSDSDSDSNKRRKKANSDSDSDKDSDNDSDDEMTRPLKKKKNSANRDERIALPGNMNTDADLDNDAEDEALSEAAAESVNQVINQIASELDNVASDSVESDFGGVVRAFASEDNASEDNASEEDASDLSGDASDEGDNDDNSEAKFADSISNLEFEYETNNGVNSDGEEVQFITQMVPEEVLRKLNAKETPSIVFRDTIDEEYEEEYFASSRNMPAHNALVVAPANRVMIPTPVLKAAIPTPAPAPVSIGHNVLVNSFELPATHLQRNVIDSMDSNPEKLVRGADATSDIGLIRESQNRAMNIGMGNLRRYV
ncbi:hypothetical protein GGF37_002445, partial [Kickxella alabastrina]